MKRIFIVAILFCSVVSCDSSSQDEGGESSEMSQSTDQEQLELHERSAILGDHWTLAALSNFFDEDLTPEQVKSRMGPKPFVNVDGSDTELMYEVLTKERFQNGCRISSVSMVFRDGRFLYAELGMEGVSSPSSGANE
ncbi:hypothetical protein ACFQY0_20955 [Haloferula chungangensis]|uniref:Uncharacterized protein n=1 Tax=Haloferula chungangensis TaxID=1048331 RepID=A0ABW2LB40_9BACT